MTTTLLIAFIIILAIVFCAIFLFLAKSTLDKKLEILQKERDEALADAKNSSAAMIAELNQRQQAELNRQESTHIEALKRERENFEKILAGMRETFTALSAEQLKRNSEDLKKGNQEQMDTLLKPVKEEFKKFSEDIEKLKLQSNSESAKLGEAIDKMMQQAMQIGNDANNLAKALKGEKKTQGNWGEAMLTDILNSCGLQEGMQYIAQNAIKDTYGNTLVADGKREIPDVIINYPEGRRLAVDSKVTLNSLVEYSNAETDEERKIALNKFLCDMKGHVNELSDKNYQEGLKKAGYDSVDFVVMFIPMESAFQLFLSTCPQVWNESYRKNVIISGPSSLLPILLMVRDAWRNFQVSANNQEIIKTGEQLFNRLNLFANHLNDLRGALAKAEKAIDSIDKTLYGSGQTVETSVKKLQGYGVKLRKGKNDKKTDKLFIDDTVEDIEIPVEEATQIEN